LDFKRLVSPRVSFYIRIAAAPYVAQFVQISEMFDFFNYTRFVPDGVSTFFISFFQSAVKVTGDYNIFLREFSKSALKV